MIQDLLTFHRFLETFRKVERVTFIDGRLEGDAEHSYALAMLGWYICEKEKLSLDTSKVIRYALVHDLVEVYAGDTFLYTKDAEFAASKEQREKDAFIRIRAEFADFDEMLEAIEAYEKHADAESRFVYSLDKIQPLLTIYEDGGKAWKKYELGLSDIIDKKKEQVALDATIEKYYEEMIALLKADEDTLFGK